MDKNSQNNSPILSENPQLNRFRAIATVILSAVTGLMIALPFAESTSPILGLAAIGAGALVGYRRRNDEWFFYLVTVIALVLTTLLVGQVVEK
jgi:LPXTG-motif cell wall-anchored protein